ncbi:hypothetical protein [Falsiroseomonas sp.]|uniref:hypothetical protein n=1 Tax=Falsiroseomonas sp. TaxID=2870721 RepID=UPI002721360E|nr:hypothetical protein [Falsiroseomonas sp.]MDO9501518.1 hypothetical protein [Falsiroseomonas sp.]MDP3417062.1 hypothetical protein [Falsiroseomonas sp.]
MAERFPLYRYETQHPDGPAEARYSFAPMEGVGYAGRGSATSAGDADTPSTEARPAGHVEAPAGSRIVNVEPPTLEVPGRGQVDISAVVGVTDGETSATSDVVLWHPAG